MEFFSLLPTLDAIKLYLDAWKYDGPPVTAAPLDEASGQVLAQDVYSAEDLPGFARSTMDGYAVRAADTFGASESAPALFTVSGEVLIGTNANADVRIGEAYRISTGAMMPRNADAVVMIEYVEDLGSGMVAVGADVAPGENVIFADEDIKVSERLLFRGVRLRAQDIGAIAAIGVTGLEVHKKPIVSVLSTGNEIVSVDSVPGPGQVRDTNGPALVSALRSMGCDAHYVGIVRDEAADMQKALEDAVAKSDAVLLSGGSSVGPYDLAPTIIDALGPPGIVVHGLAIKPGKPTILALSDKKPVIGLPGHPASSLVVFQVVVAPIIRALCGETDIFAHPPSVEATLERNLASSAGREDYIRVSLQHKDGELRAIPVLGKSGLISTLIRSHGILKIPLESGGYEAGQRVKVHLWTI